MDHLTRLIKGLLPAIFLFTGLQATAADELLQSKEIRRLACELLSSYYPPYHGDFYDADRPISEFGIEINLESCSEMKAVVTRKHEKQVGSKTFIDALYLSFSDENANCEVVAARKIDIELNEKDEPRIIVKNWEIYESRDQTCFVPAAPELISADLDKKNNGLKKITEDDLPNGLYIPHYLDLDEPDDSAVGYEFTPYALEKNGKLLGYILDYWYANTEGEWASRYILKYNNKGVLVGNLIEKEGYDFCDYPFFTEDDTWAKERCQKQ